jgi:hypothetical protein
MDGTMAEVLPLIFEKWDVVMGVMGVMVLMMMVYDGGVIVVIVLISYYIVIPCLFL